MNKLLHRSKLILYLLINKPSSLLVYFDKIKTFKKIQIYSDIETINHLINQNNSLLRLGDSDLAYIRDNFFSNVDDKKSFIDIYKKILENNILDLIIGVPNLYIKNSNFKIIPRDNFNFKNWANILPILFFYLRYDKKYGSSFVFREINFYPQEKFKELNLHFVKYIEETKKNVLFISDMNHLKDKIKRDLSMYIIEDWSESELNVHCYNILSKYETKNTLILIRVKILSRILGFKLINKGYQVIDIGQLN